MITDDIHILQSKPEENGFKNVLSHKKALLVKNNFLESFYLQFSFDIWSKQYDDWSFEWMIGVWHFNGMLGYSSLCVECSIFNTVFSFNVFFYLSCILKCKKICHKNIVRTIFFFFSDFSHKNQNSFKKIELSWFVMSAFSLQCDVENIVSSFLG